MKRMKTPLTAAFWVLIAALMLAPILLILRLSQAEMEQYATPATPLYRETAMGTAVQSYRADVYEYVTVSGVFTSTAYEYMELDQRDPQLIRWNVDVGDEVHAGDVIGTYNGQPVTASVSGILAGMELTGADPYLRFQAFTPLELECRVDDDTLAVLRRSEVMTTTEGQTVTMTFASMAKNADGTITIRLAVEGGNYAYGQELGALQILSGRVYRNALVVPAVCVYQKVSGEDAPWYVRQVTEAGDLIGEIKVTVAYNDGSVACVSGIEEGDWFDSGYKYVMEGG